MATYFQKILAAEGSANYSPNGLNRMTFQIDTQNEMIDLGKSYCLFDVNIIGSNATTYFNNWVWGNNGVKYDSSCLIRNIILSEQGKGELENVVCQNVLSQSLNLNYCMGKSEQKAMEIFNMYAGETGSDGQSYMYNSPWITYQSSNINTTPTTATSYATASVIMPLKNTCLGLAKTGPVEFENPLTLRFELEDQQNLLTQGYATTAKISNVAIPSGGTTYYTSNSVVCEPVFLNGIYAQATVTGTSTYTLTCPQATQYTDPSGNPSFYPINPNEMLISNAAPCICFVSYSSSATGLNYVDEVVQYISVAYSAGNYTLTLLNPLHNAEGTTATLSNGGCINVAVRFPMCGSVTVSEAAQVKTIQIQVPSVDKNLSNFPFTVNQSIDVFGPSVNGTATYKITAIAKTANASPGKNKVDNIILTLNSNIPTPTTNANYPVFLSGSSDSADGIQCSWRISNPQLSLAIVKETHEMKAMRRNKREKMNIKHLDYFTWQLEQYSVPTAFSSFSRQWYCLNETTLAVLCTPVNGSLVSEVDNVNYIRPILNGEQITSRPILLNGLNTAGSQIYEWIRKTLFNCGDITIKQVQQIAPDKPNSNVVYPIPISDLRFHQEDQTRQQHVLDVQLYTNNSAVTSSAKMMYLFKLHIKSL